MSCSIRSIACTLCLLLCGTRLHAQTPPAPPPSALLTDPQAQAHRDAAAALAAKYDYAGAIQEYQQAYLLDKVSHLQNAGTDLNDIGAVYNHLSQYNTAVDFFQQALAIEREVKNKNGEATLLNNLGSAYDSLSQYDKAIDFFQQALIINREVKSMAGEAGTLNNLGIAYDNLSQYGKGIDFFQQALFIFREINSTAGKAAALSNLGYAYVHLSQYDNAIDFYQEALTFERQVKNRLEEAGILSNIGDAYTRLGRYNKAIGFFQKALSIEREVKIRAGESITLNNLGSAYIHLGRYDKGIYFFQQVLIIQREIKDRAREATALNNLGAAYSNLSQQDKAIAFYQKALTIQREIKDQDGEATTLNNIGAVYGYLSQYDKAVDFYRQALTLRREIKDRAGEAGTLNNLAGGYKGLSQYDKAVDFYQQALVLCREVKDQEGVGNTLSNLGGVYISLSQYDKAIGFLRQALLIDREIHARDREGITLNNLGQAYEGLDQHAKAIDFDQQALAIEREVKDRNGEATTLSNIGGAYDSLSQYAKAIGFYQQALALRQEIKDRAGVAVTLNDLGYSYSSLRRNAKAIDLYQQALAIHREVKNREGEAATLGNLMFSWKSSGTTGLAIFYGKQGVNVYQSIRADLRMMDQKTQKTYQASNEKTYRTLAEMLISQGRLPEAQQVLGLLKVEEYFDFVRRDPTQAPANTLLALTMREAPWEARYRQIANHVTAIGTEQAELQAALRAQVKAGKPVSTQDGQHLAALTSDLGVAKQAFNRFLTELDTTAFVDHKEAHVNAAALQDAIGLESDLRQMGQGAVALYTLVGQDKYRVLLVTPTTQKAEEYPITAAELNKKVLAFRQALQDPQADPQPLAKELYTILFCHGRLAQDLAGAKAQTLMWSLDGTLRYLPVAALHDGRQYLVETYRNVVFTPASNARLKDAVSPKWTALGLGVSKAHHVTLGGAEGEAGSRGSDFPALPGVVGELHGIIQGESGAASGGVLPGAVELDGAFTQSAMTSALLLGNYPLVHIASHFRFVPGDETASYLLLGDGTPLSLAQINALPNFFSGVQLLTLSACNTASGDTGADGKEVEGFGVLAQRQGAEAVLASLWEVADASTPKLMEEFYRRREAVAGTSKAAALQQAQLSLLHGPDAGSVGDTKSRATEAVSAPRSPAGTPSFPRDPKAPYAHPFYWAPFILIGNWR